MKRLLKLLPNLMISLFLLTPSIAAQAQTAGPYVDSIEGNVTMFTDGASDPKALIQGTSIKPYDTVQTNQGGKVLVRWNEAFALSLGEMSSFFLSSDDNTGVKIEMVDGAIRAVRNQIPGNNPNELTFVTPMATISPDSIYEPVDFIVESYDPSSTIVTVISGRMRVRNLETNSEKTVNACQSVYVTKGKTGFDTAAAAPELLASLLDSTTIQGTLAARSDTCGIPLAISKLNPPVTYAPQPDYFVDESQFVEFYPYQDITVLPPDSGNEWTAVVPGVGRFFIPVPTDYPVTPELVRGFAQYFFVNQSININNVYVKNIRVRIKELNNLIYVSQRAGKLDLVANATSELRSLKRQEKLASSRLDRLQQRAARIDTDAKIKNNKELYNKVVNNIQIPQNSGILEKFQSRSQQQLAMQSKLTGLADNQINAIRNKMSKETDPGRRAALRNQISQIQSNAEQGKIPISPDDRNVRNLVKNITSTQDPEKRIQLQDRLDQALNRVESNRRQGDVLSQGTLDDLKQSLSQERPGSETTKKDVQDRLSQMQETLKSHPEIAAGAGALAGAVLGHQLAGQNRGQQNGANDKSANRMSNLTNANRQGQQDLNRDNLRNRSLARDRAAVNQKDTAGNNLRKSARESLVNPNGSETQQAERLRSHGLNQLDSRRNARANMRELNRQQNTEAFRNRQTEELRRNLARSHEGNFAQRRDLDSQRAQNRLQRQADQERLRSQQNQAANLRQQQLDRSRLESATRMQQQAAKLQQQQSARLQQQQSAARLQQQQSAARLQQQQSAARLQQQQSARLQQQAASLRSQQMKNLQSRAMAPSMAQPRQMAPAFKGGAGRGQGGPAKPEDLRKFMRK